MAGQPDYARLKQQLADYARTLRFDACGVAAPEAIAGELEHHRRWLGLNYQARMDYLARDPAGRYDPRALLPHCQRVVVLAHGIYAEPDGELPSEAARVARYAWGDDYHDVIGDKLNKLGAWLDERVPEHRWKATVDTAPLSEKALALAAGLGWRGGHSLVLNARLGSCFMLGCLLTSAPLPADSPLDNRCGACRLCLEACPTGALVDFGVLDARRCISYANGSRRGEPDDVPTLGGWLYGCDACQQVCPYNGAPLPTAEPRFSPHLGMLRLSAREVLGLESEEFERRYAGTVIHGRGLARLQAAARIISRGQDGSLGQ